MGSVGNEDRRLALDAGGGRPLPAFRKLEARFLDGYISRAKGGRELFFRPYEVCKVRTRLPAGSINAASRKKPSSTGHWHIILRLFSKFMKSGFSQPLATFERSYKLPYINS